MSDRGVSETIGFVLVFALVTGTIGIVYATGITGLQDAQEEEKLQNVQRAFEVLADNLGDLHERGAPSRATEVKLSGGTVETGTPVSVEIYAEHESDPMRNETYTATFEPIVYREGGETIMAYSSGAVFRQGSAGSAMLVEPDWVIDGNRSTVPLVSTTGRTGGMGGDSAVLIVADSQSRTLQDPFVVGPGAQARVNVTVRSPRVGAWKRFFEDRGLDPVDPSVDHENVTYQFRTERIYVTKTDVEVSFDR